MSEEVNPNELVSAIAKPRLTVSMIISFVVHIVLLVVFSIGFIMLCFQYKTTHPKAAIKAEQKLKQEEEEKKAREERYKAAQLKAQEEAKDAKDNSNSAKAPAKAKADAPAERKKSAYEQKLEESLPPESASGSLQDGLSF